jgi:hypothetical protein
MESEVRDDRGLVSLLQSIDQGEEPDLVQHILRVSESDELYCLPAGIPNADYARRLRMIDPEAWYREENNPLRLLLDRLANVRFRPDVILLDARTGMSPLSAPLLFDLSDIAVITFFPHPQARRGTQELVRALLSCTCRRTWNGQRLTPEPRFIVSMIPDSKSLEVVQKYKQRATEWVTEWLAPMEERREGSASPPVEASDIMHFVPYRELIATSDRILKDDSAWQIYAPVSEWFERFIPTKSDELGVIDLTTSKQSILNSLEFSTGTAETQEHFLSNFVKTQLVEKAMSPEKPLVLGRKGTGKTAVFRKILEGSEYPCVPVISPATFRKDRPWILGSDAFKAIDLRLQKTGQGWREFWSVYTPLAVWLAQRSNPMPLPESPLLTHLQSLPCNDALTERQLIACLESMLSEHQQSLLGWDWLRALDRALQPRTLLILDGLDSGFGSTPDDRVRRSQAIEGLFAFVTDRESGLTMAHFKIFLREDIWRAIRFENKSHLYGRSVRLEWHSQADYVKTVLKQAVRNEAFAKLVLVNTRMDPSELDQWPDEATFAAWNVLVGERMKGGKTTYTRNWVWNRLADGKGDHSPRALFQLLREATLWEREEHRKNAYDKTVIRPRALISSLPRVSGEAIQALFEEFKELEDVVTKLREIGRSPVDASELRELQDLDLAREIGLLQVYEGTEEEVQRYRVPDLYRIGIPMTRKGQA